MTLFDITLNFSENISWILVLSVSSICLSLSSVVIFVMLFQSYVTAFPKKSGVHCHLFIF